MYKIIKIQEDKIYLGDENGSFTTVPRSSANYDNPEVGDYVNLFQGEGYAVISKADNKLSPETKKSKVKKKGGGISLFIKGSGSLS